MPNADAVFRYAWMGAAVSMLVHIGGLSLELWGHRAAPYWMALIFLLATVGTTADGCRGEPDVQ